MIKDDPKIVILLTATVNPNGMSMTSIQNVQERRSQYIDTIKFWSTVENVNLVLVENSNTSLKEDFRNIETLQDIEILTFDGNNYDRSIGKGYGEYNCMDYAVRNSVFIKNSDWIFKVTGRYSILNFTSFFNYYLQNLDIDLMVDFKLNLTFADSRFFGFRKEFITNYLSKYKTIVDDSKGIYFENILLKASLNAIADGYVYRPYPTLPRIRGYSGSLGTKYNDSFLHWLRHQYKYYLKYKSIGLGHMPEL